MGPDGTGPESYVAPPELVVPAAGSEVVPAARLEVLPAGLTDSGVPPVGDRRDVTGMRR